MNLCVLTADIPGSVLGINPEGREMPRKMLIVAGQRGHNNSRITLGIGVVKSWTRTIRMTFRQPCRYADCGQYEEIMQGYKFGADICLLAVMEVGRYTPPRRNLLTLLCLDRKMSAAASRTRLLGL